MIDLVELANAMGTALQNIPDLMANLAQQNPVMVYVDLTPSRNSLERARYQMQPGSLLLAWTDSGIKEGEVSRLTHTIEIYLRAQNNASDQDLIRQIMNGVPVPGDGNRWRYCPLIAGVYPTDVTKIMRRTDEEGVDYVAMITETAETGDY